MKKIFSLALAFAMGLTVASGVVLAATNWKDISVAWSPFRIRTSMGDVVQWGDTYDLNGVKMPTSMVYNDTTYVPLRKITELLDTNVYFDGDSGTISLIKHAGSSVNIKANATDGKTYKYEIGSNEYTGQGTLLISRGQLFPTMGGQMNKWISEPNYERAYSVASAYSYSVLDDGIIYVKANYSNSFSNLATSFGIVKISYNFDANSQDGQVIRTVSLPQIANAMQAVAIDNGKFVYAYPNSSDASLGFYYATVDIATGAIHQCTPAEKAGYVERFGKLSNDYGV